MKVKEIKNRIAILNLELSTLIAELAYEGGNEFLRLHIQKVRSELDTLENELSDLE